MAEKSKPLTKEEKRSRGWEIFWYCLFGLIWVAGIALGIIGICAHNVGWLTYNPLYQAETSLTNWLNWGFRIDFRVFGAVLILIGTIGLIIDLFVYANKHDKEKIKEQRRATRLQAILKDSGMNIDDLVRPGFDKAPEKKPVSQPEKK